jgi:hypothetical protein
MFATYTHMRISAGPESLTWHHTDRYCPGSEYCRNIKILTPPSGAAQAARASLTLNLALTLTLTLTQALPKLHELLFKGNAFHHKFLSEGNDEKAYRLEILMRLPNLKVLDGLHVEDDERAEAQARS